MSLNKNELKQKKNQQQRRYCFFFGNLDPFSLIVHSVSHKVGNITNKLLTFISSSFFRHQKEILTLNSSFKISENNSDWPDLN